MTSNSSVIHAFHGDPAIKAEYLARVLEHEKADEIVHGKYWEGGKGCAVGCTLHSADHMDYESKLGIPVALARLEDTLFEGQPNGQAKSFPARFLSAIKRGADVLVPLTKGASAASAADSARSAADSARSAAASADSAAYSAYSAASAASADSA